MPQRIFGQRTGLGIAKLAGGIAPQGRHAHPGRHEHVGDGVGGPVLVGACHGLRGGERDARRVHVLVGNPRMGAQVSAYVVPTGNA